MLPKMLNDIQNGPLIKSVVVFDELIPRCPNNVKHDYNKKQ